MSSGTLLILVILVGSLGVGALSVGALRYREATRTEWVPVTATVTAHEADVRELRTGSRGKLEPHELTRVVVGYTLDDAPHTWAFHRAQPLAEELHPVGSELSIWVSRDFPDAGRLKSPQGTLPVILLVAGALLLMCAGALVVFRRVVIVGEGAAA